MCDVESDDRAWVAPEASAEPDPRAPAMAPMDRVPDDRATVAPPAPVGPMTVSDILDGSYTIIKRRPRAVIGAVAVVIVPVQVTAVWLQSLAEAPVDQSAYGALSSLSSGESLPVTMLVAALASLSLFFVGGIVASFVVAWYSGRDIGATDALRATFRRSWVFLVAWAVLLPIKAVSYALCIFPLAVTVTFFALTAPVIVVERLGPFAAIKRSAQLIARRFWPALGIVLLSSLVETVLQLALSAIPMIVAVFLPSPADWIVQATGEAAAALIATTALVGVSVLLYVDLRNRSEGLDLELRATDAFDHANRA
jgi:hypothetical protein